MPRKPRESSGTGIYHVMLRGINRQDIFEDAEDYWTFIRMMSAVPCYIYAYCLMPNHVHLLIAEKSLKVGEVVKSIASCYVLRDQGERHLSYTQTPVLMTRSAKAKGLYAVRDY